MAATVGVFWAGPGAVMDSPIDVPYKIENAEFKTFEGVTLNGNIRTTRLYTGGRGIYEVKFSLQSNYASDSLRVTYRSAKGKGYPIYFSEDPTTTGNLSRLVFFADDYLPIETTGYNLNTVSVRMKTYTADW